MQLIRYLKSLESDLDLKQTLSNSPSNNLENFDFAKIAGTVLSYKV